MTDTTIRPGQCYAHINHTRYYEVKAIFGGQVEFIVYNSQTNDQEYGTRSIDVFSRLVRDNILIRDV